MPPSLVPKILDTSSSQLTDPCDENVLSAKPASLPYYFMEVDFFTVSVFLGTPEGLGKKGQNIFRSNLVNQSI